MFIAGLLLFSAASLAGGFADSQAFLLTARAVQGAGGALVAPAALSLITTTFPEGPPRTRALGVYAAMSIAGGAIGLIGGGLLTTYASWRWVLFVNVPIGAAVALAAPRVLAETPRRRGRFDLPGAITGTAGVAALVYGLISAATSPNGVSHWGDAKVLASLAAGAAAARPQPHRRLPQLRRGGHLHLRHVLLPHRVHADRLGLLPPEDRPRLPPVHRSPVPRSRGRRPARAQDRRPPAAAGRLRGRRRRPVLAVADQRARHLRQRGVRPDHGHRSRDRPAVRHAVPGRAEPRPRSRLRGRLQPAQHRPASRRLHRPGGARHRRLDRRRPQHPRPGRPRRRHSRAGRAPCAPGRPAGRSDLQPCPRHRVRPRVPRRRRDRAAHPDHQHRRYPGPPRRPRRHPATRTRHARPPRTTAVTAAHCASTVPNQKGKQMSQDQHPGADGDFFVTFFLVVSDQDRSRNFYQSVFGGKVLRERDPVILEVANATLILNDGGGPTDDKPTVTLTTPPDPDQVSAFLNIRVTDIATASKIWSARGAEFLTEPKDHGREIRAYIRAPDGHLIEVGQTTPTPSS